MNRQIWNSQNGADSAMPAMKATLSRISAPPNTSVTSSAQSPEVEPVPRARLSAGIEQYGARMNAPRPWSYHQKQNAVAIPMTSSASATRLRSSRRCAIRLIVAAASRGGRRRRPGLLTVGPSPRERSAATVGHAGLLGAGPQLRGAGLGRPGLRLGGLRRQLRGQVDRRRGGRGHDRRGLGGVLGADVGAHVVVLHALHLALEDPQRAADRARRIGQLLVPEEQQDGEDDQDDLRGAEVHRVLQGWDGTGDATPRD